ncbi:hypothetical protein [Candidatus Enterococcus ikei]|uniref:Uncharacterized protein n=1 Tax=Candidatus Enterococcus ikei TaxID=2815326 RepID=A0ABS3H1V6_9ENTE|nr:hypothetical protein [Enterococcus sp. DIV0869a]MBO0441511.1 hypothetical protein [Enterococcus sp. DIV0869a]
MFELLLPTLLLTSMFNHDSEKSEKYQFPNFPKAEYKVCNLDELDRIPIENTKDKPPYS